MNLIWSPRARQHLDEIFDYILADNPDAAARILDAIDARTRQLTAHADLGRPGRVLGTRELVVPGTPYIIAYRAGAGARTIEILAVIHGARLWPEGFE